MTALFEQVKTGLKHAIASGEFEVGQVLPPVDALAKRGRCSVGTVRRAVSELTQQGVLRPVQRRGTIVVKRPACGRVAVLRADDEHSNHLLGARLYESLRKRHVQVDLVPGGLDVEAMNQKLDELECGGGPIDMLVSLWPECSSGQLAASKRVPAGVAYSFMPAPLSGVFDWVGPDLRWMARDVIEHLLALGHRRIAVVSGYPSDTADDWSTITCEHARHLVEVAGGRFFPHQLGVDNWGRLASLVREQGVTAYWALNDYLALLAMSSCHRAGIRTPEDLTLIGRYDTPWCQMTQPTLTSVSIDPQATSEAIADAVVWRLANASAPSVTRLIRPQLTARQSSAAPRA